MANNNNGNQFRDDENVVLTKKRDGKMLKNIFRKIGGRLRLAHEENDQLSITTEIIKYDENPAVVKGATSRRAARAFNRKSKDSASPKLSEKCLPRQDLYPILRFTRPRIETYQQGSSNTVFFFKPTEPFQMGLIGELCRLHFDRYFMIAQNKIHLEPGSGSPIGHRVIEIRVCRVG